MAEYEPQPTPQVSPEQPRGSRRFSITGALAIGSIATGGGFSWFELCIPAILILTK